MRQRLVAASQLGKREPEVVLGVGLVGLAAALKSGHGLLRDPRCTGPVARLKQARRLVGERDPVPS